DEFMQKYNNNIPEPLTEETAESSDDYLELAYEAESYKDAKKYAKEALVRDPYNFDAESLLIDLNVNDATKLVREYAKAVGRATEHMREEGYFEDDCVGSFWGILETRPYMRLRANYVRWLIACGMIGEAKGECVELLRLCEGDNLGMRYVLMHIYVYFEDEEGALALHKQFGSYDETEMLFPLSVLYYKKSDYTKARQYLRKLNGENKDLKKFLKLITGESDRGFDGFELEGGYRPGTIEELMLEIRDNDFLFMTMDSYIEWALQQVKRFK
ncbi:MAG: hypothetical protein IJV66_01515, partial [Firmicutes bacterium]|nr:hypothetical protein [Bacillota bacterium]